MKLIPFWSKHTIIKFYCAHKRMSQVVPVLYNRFTGWPLYLTLVISITVTVLSHVTLKQYEQQTSLRQILFLVLKQSLFLTSV